MAFKCADVQISDVQMRNYIPDVQILDVQICGLCYLSLLFNLLMKLFFLKP
jgi:hypothetical protein